MERRPTIMTVQEVARYLRLHTITVYRMIRQGSLPAIRVGRGWRFQKGEIDRYLHEHQANSHNPPANPTRPPAKPARPRATPARPRGRPRRRPRASR